MKHLEIGGSTIARTINCPAWVNRSKTTIRKPAGEAANLGNLLHDAMENYYSNGETFEAQIARCLKYADIILTDEHLPILNKMVSATEEVLDKYNITIILCEPFVELIKDFAGGSIDMLGVSEDGKTAITLDYKTGRAPVKAKDNDQLRFYTLCATRDSKTSDMLKDVDTYVGAIVQPHVHGYTADIFEFDKEQLKSFSEVVNKAIVDTKAKKPKALAGTHCMYCPRASFCPEKRTQAKTAYLFNNKDKAALSQAVTLAKDLKGWCNQVIEDAEFFLGEGAKIAGFKLVHGRSVRKWANSDTAEKELIDVLGESAYIKKMCSPTQAIAALKKLGIELDYYDEIIDKPLGKITIVEEDDPREEINTEFINKNLNNFLTTKTK